MISATKANPELAAQGWSTTQPMYKPAKQLTINRCSNGFILRVGEDHNPNNLIVMTDLFDLKAFLDKWAME